MDDPRLSEFEVVAEQLNNQKTANAALRKRMDALSAENAELTKRLDALQKTGEKSRLNPADPFDASVIELVAMNRKKRADYAADDRIFSNFDDVATMRGDDTFKSVDSAYTLLLTKIARIRSLRKNGRLLDTRNESVLDTFLDLAVYGIIVYSLAKEEYATPKIKSFDEIFQEVGCGCDEGCECDDV